MLYFLGSNWKKITDIPKKRKSEFDQWSKNLPDADLAKIHKAFDDIFDSEEKNVHTAGWLPGNDWTNTPYQPIYVACGNNKVLSGFFFGLLVFKYIIERDDHWGCGRYEANGQDIKSITYFKLPTAPI